MRSVAICLVVTLTACGGRTDAQSDGEGQGVGGADAGPTPQGLSCADAIPITVTDDALTLSATTVGGGDAHPKLTCGSGQVAWTFEHPQIYYRLLPAGEREYEFRIQVGKRFFDSHRRMPATSSPSTATRARVSTRCRFC